MGADGVEIRIFAFNGRCVGSAPGRRYRFGRELDLLARSL